jgi:hypothetical protein
MSIYDVSVVFWYMYKMAYAYDNRDPDISTHEKVGSMTEKGLDNSGVDRVKERTRSEFPV